MGLASNLLVCLGGLTRTLLLTIEGPGSSGVPFQAKHDVTPVSNAMLRIYVFKECCLQVIAFWPNVPGRSPRCPATIIVILRLAPCASTVATARWYTRCGNGTGRSPNMEMSIEASGIYRRTEPDV